MVKNILVLIKIRMTGTKIFCFRNILCVYSDKQMISPYVYVDMLFFIILQTSTYEI